MSANFYGGSPQAQLKDKIGQMRRDMMHMQRALSVIESKVGANASADDMKPNFGLLYLWFLSAGESLFAMTWLVYDGEKVKKVIQNFYDKFSTFTTSKTIIIGGRPK